MYYRQYAHLTCDLTRQVNRERIDVIHIIIHNNRYIARRVLTVANSNLQFLVQITEAIMQLGNQSTIYMTHNDIFATTSVRENVCNLSKNVKSHVFGFSKK